MSAAPITLRLTPQAMDAWQESLAKAPSDGGACVLLKRDEVADLIHDAWAARKLLRLIDTPELVDFARGVQMEAVHQVQRWGSADRESKDPAAWFWLLSHLATRALEHHKEAERIASECFVDPPNEAHRAAIAHHREKAAHHTITAAAVLAHWHASVIGKATGVQAGAPALKAEADALAGGTAA